MWELYHKEGWAPKNWCIWTVVLEKTFESPLDCKEIQPVHPKGNQSSVFTGRTNAEAETPILLATWCKELILQKRPWCWERLKAGGEGDDRGWEGDNRRQDGWMTSPTLWTRVWVSSGNWWWTGKPGMLQSREWQRVEHSWAIQLNWTWYLSLQKCMCKYPHRHTERHFKNTSSYCVITFAVLFTREAISWSYYLICVFLSGHMFIFINNT